MEQYAIFNPKTLEYYVGTRFHHGVLWRSTPDLVFNTLECAQAQCKELNAYLHVTWLTVVCIIVKGVQNDT